MSRDWKIAVIVSFALVSVFTLTLLVARDTRAQAPPPVTVVTAELPAEYCPPFDIPQTIEPTEHVPSLVEAATTNIDRRIKALAGELAAMWTRNPEELVMVIDEASRQATTSPSVTLLLAIAHAETNGQILDVSEAGAVGLAQATPIAVRQEGLEGKLFVTRDYLIGSRAYIMKKPLGDADTIATMVVDRDDPKTRKRAKKLLRSAFDLRREGMDELDLLEPYATDRYFTLIREADRHNVATLKRLQKLLDTGSRKQLRTFRDTVRKEYRDMKRVQLEAWRRYQLELIARRDTMLEEHFGEPASIVKRKRPYEAGEFLARELDERFSAKTMAAFLVRHLDRKGDEARKLAGKNKNVEEMTAALYNGGSHNVKRMLAGLIRSLPETQRYMKKVPATRKRLDIAAASALEPLVETR